MDEIVNYLHQSIADVFYSKAKYKMLNQLVRNHVFTQDQLQFLRNTAYQLAYAKINDSNYRFILDWLKDTTNAFTLPTNQTVSQVFFSPGEECRTIIIDQINRATKRIKICVFTISDDQITNAILEAHRRGISISILTDNDKLFDRGSDILQLAREGITIKTDNTSDHMHHKFMVIDNASLLTGSYNWTRSAASVNHENIILTTEAAVINSFLTEFEKLWNTMTRHTIPEHHSNQ